MISLVVPLVAELLGRKRIGRYSGDNLGSTSEIRQLISLSSLTDRPTDRLTGCRVSWLTGCSVGRSLGRRRRRAMNHMLFLCNDDDDDDDGGSGGIAGGGSDWLADWLAGRPTTSPMHIILGYLLSVSSHFVSLSERPSSSQHRRRRPRRSLSLLAR